MKNIKILDKSIAQKIAAGEVVERPSSVVKELLENSVDAGSSFITVEIEEGGKKLIRVSDNGCGIYPEDLELAFVRHATSKIETEEDLFNINQLGFRGEALYSISAVSKTTMLSKIHDLELGKKITIHGGEVIYNNEVGCPNGTTVIIEDLFYNTPARKKFMKNNSAETSQIASIIQKIILARADISIKLIVNGSLIYQSSGDGNLINAIHSIYGTKISNNIYEFCEVFENIRVFGALGNKDIFRNSRINQTLFVNLRYVKDKEIIQSIESAYGSLLMKGRFPFFVVFIEIDTKDVDVNVHPQKLFVKFSNIDRIKNAVFEAVKIFTNKIGAVPDYLLNTKNANVKLEPKRKAYSFEKKDNNGLIKLTDTNNTDIKNVKKTFEYQAPKTYDYKNEIERKKKLTEPLVMKQSPINLNIQQKDYLDEFSDSINIGVAFNSYIIIQHQTDLYFIDQHAAHERLLYEKLYKQYKENLIVSQLLLIPQRLDLTYEEKILLDDYMQYFIKLGFKFSENNDNSIMLREVPLLLGQPKFDGFFFEFFDLISTNDNSKDSMIEKIITISCKRAVKAGDTLSQGEISYLIKAIIKEDIPLTCPHGRPFVMKITKKQIDKKAGRIN